MDIHILLFILAAICWLLAAFRVQAPVDFWPLGWVFVALTFIIK